MLAAIPTLIGLVILSLLIRAPRSDPYQALSLLTGWEKQRPKSLLCSTTNIAWIFSSVRKSFFFVFLL